VRSEAQLLRLANEVFGDMDTGFAVVIPRLHKLPNSEQPLLKAVGSDATDLDIVQAGGAVVGVADASLHAFCARMYLPAAAELFPLSTDSVAGAPVAAPHMKFRVQSRQVNLQCTNRGHAWHAALAEGCTPSPRLTRLLSVGANTARRMTLRFITAHEKEAHRRHSLPWGERPAFFLAAYDRQLDVVPDQRFCDVAAGLAEIEKSLSGAGISRGWKQLKHLCGDMLRSIEANINEGAQHNGAKILAKAQWSQLTGKQRRFCFGVGIIGLLRIDHLPLDPVRCCRAAMTRARLHH
jgi:hypothetical protein